MGAVEAARQAGCELCEQDGGIVLLQIAQWRLIRAIDADHPAFYRVIWNAHVSEWTDLSSTDRQVMMGAVETVETVLRECLRPTKVNLASLGNVVPHLHWHVIARFTWDARWPAPVWAPQQREVVDAAAQLAMPLTELDAAVVRALQALTSAP